MRGSGAGCNQEKKKHWPGKVFKSVIFSAISLSWCVASSLTGRPCSLREHELEQGLSLSSPLIAAHHLHPERERDSWRGSSREPKEKNGRESSQGAKIDANSVASECEGAPWIVK